MSYEDFLKGISSFALALLHLHNSDHVLLTLYSDIVDIQLFLKQQQNKDKQARTAC